MWCSFEIYKTITSDSTDTDLNHHLGLDICSVSREGDDIQVQLLVEEPLPGEPHRAKRVRERAFPHHLLVLGMTQNLEEGECYSELDKKRILNFMGRDGVGKTQKERNADAVARANQRLKAHFAILSWPFAIENDIVLDFDGDASNGQALSIIELLKADSARRQLDFSLAHFEEVTSLHLKQLADGLPPNLEDIEFSFEGCVQIENAGLQAFAGKFPSTVQRLRINLMGCTEISDDGIIALAEELRNMPKLREFRLVCYMCHDLTAECFVHLSQHMPKSVQKVLVQMKGTAAEKDVKSIRELQQAARAARGADAQRASFALPGWVSR